MKPTPSESIHRPFERLAKLLRERPLAPGPAPAAGPPAPAAPPRPEPTEMELFARAMAGVAPLCAGGRDRPPPQPAPAREPPPAEADALDRLAQLVACGEGFRVADTPEYMEGVGCQAPPGITRRLHRGDFAVQAHLDLHGLNAGEAQAAFESFVRQSLLAGKRSLLVIHGRGLSSPADPVLKSKLIQWLTRGPWRKWVIAFTSARLCDGGVGASYVLLRRRPLTKRHRRQDPQKKSLTS
ncbi:MAG: Smr/MutS family endonuclease [Desulfobacterales bacterium]|jgi:DNA-nicking Smr family endonuclease|nr:Smr/MutS family endonuclease [Desulfobacterales bacterium]